MSSQVISVLAPRPVAAPRGAQWAANAVFWILLAVSPRPAKEVLK